LARLSGEPENGRPSSEVPKSINEATGERERKRKKRAAWKPFFKAAREVNQETFAQQKQPRDEEVRLHRELAQELIDLGFRALAMRLHPDRGGSKDAMSRLNPPPTVLGRCNPESVPLHPDRSCRPVDPGRYFVIGHRSQHS
jgi:hypothetical protein